VITLKRLTNEDVMSEMKKFHRYRMDADQKNAILGNLAQLGAKRKRGSISAFFNPVLSMIVLVVFLASASFIALDHAKAPGSPELPKKAETGIQQFQQANESFSIQEYETFTLKENKDGTVLFIADGKTVGGIEPLNEDEMVKSINQQNLMKKEELEGYQYPATFTLDHQKTMDVVQILHYYFTSPESKLNYHVYFYTPFFNDESADEIARSFNINKEGKLVNGEEQWSLSNEYSTHTFRLLTGEKDRLGVDGAPFTAGKTKRHVWHFFGSHNEVETISSGDFKVIALSKENGEKEQVLVEGAGTKNEKLVWEYKMNEDRSLTGDSDTGSLHSITSHLRFSKPGIWKLDVYFGVKRFGSIIVDVK
jgi:hypothetical protein